MLIIDPLVNLRREKYTFIISEHSKDKVHDLNVNIIAISNSLTFTNVNDQPVYGRLAYTNNSPHEMLLLFTSGEYNNQIPIVKIKQNNQIQIYYGKSYKAPYNITDLCDAPANNKTMFIDPGYRHEILIKNLQLNNTYQYQYGFKNGKLSPSYSFYTGNKDEEVAILFGDMGSKLPFNPIITASFDSAQQSINLMKKWLHLKSSSKYHLNLNKKNNGQDDLFNNKYSTLIHIGDLAYARGYATVWDYFLNNIQDISSSIPYMTGIGNHEFDYLNQTFKPINSDYSSDSGGECGLPYQSNFKMPLPLNKTFINNDRDYRNNTWYSFIKGPILYVVMSSEHNFTVNSIQYQFLEYTLSTIDRSITPWLILLSHRPLYSSISGWEKRSIYSYDLLSSKY